MVRIQPHTYVFGHVLNDDVGGDINIQVKFQGFFSHKNKDWPFRMQNLTPSLK